MHITQTVKTILETASAKALATKSVEDVNVVPVSMIRVNESDIWLFDFFMDKTVRNARITTVVALTAWEGMKGIQIKGDITHVTEGDVFTESVAWVQSQNPDRVVKGVLVLKPNAIFDVSPGGAYSAEDLGTD